VDYDCRLIRDIRGKYYLNVPCYVSACDNKARVNTEAQSWGALDPGVRTFQTIYSPTTGVAYKIGQGDIARIYRLCLHLDRLLSIKPKGFDLTQKKKGQTTRQSNQRKIKNLRLKIRHLIDEVHWKTINFLLKNFMNVVIPVFGVQTMINRRTRKISKQSVRKMLGWRHYTFRQRLIASAKKTSTKIHVIGEEYTTQTCGFCMKLYKSIGGREVYKCPSCGIKMDRDLNGSRNIFMMNCELTRDFHHNEISNDHPTELVKQTVEVVVDRTIVVAQITDLDLMLM
jgi:putative transposase